MRKLKLIITIFVCLFLFTGVVACSDKEGQQEQTNQPQSSVDVSKATFADETKEYTGEPLAITVKNLPGGVVVEYTYKQNGVEVEKMIEIGTYEVTATIKDKVTKEVLRTLTATFTIKEKEIYDEIKDDANALIKLTYGTTYIQMQKNPEDETQLVALGLELWASEEIYFVLGDSVAPLNFIKLAEGSVEVAKVEDNKLIISRAGYYDVYMIFAAGEKVPSILVQEGEANNEYYFLSSLYNNEATEETLFTIDETAKTATFELELEAGEEFLISNFSRQFTYDSSFGGMDPFEAGEDGYVKVCEAGTYKFEVSLVYKSLTVYKDGVAVIQDTNFLYFRGSMNGWGTETKLSKKNGIATIELLLNVGDVFKIADEGWGVEYAYGYVSGAADYFEEGKNDEGNLNGNIVVKQAGTYKFEVNVGEKALTVYKDGTKIVDNVKAGSSSGGATSISPSTNLYLRGTMNGWDASTMLSKQQEGTDTIAYIKTDLNVGDVFKIADSSWKTELNYGHFKAGVEHFKEGVENGNIEVIKAGSYEFKINLSQGILVVIVDGVTIFENNFSGNGGSSSEVTGEVTLYLKPNSEWLSDGARFAIYCFGNSEAWFDMKDSDKDGIYEAVIGNFENYTGIIFCRMNGAASDNNWDNKWNQTADLTFDGTNNMFTVNAGSWDAGTWSKK